MPKNKSDLRYIKTEKLIRDTYLALKQKSRAAVKVNKLCETALINKTTFYVHYDTITALHERVCIDTIEKMLDETPNIDLAFSDTRPFVNSLVQTLHTHQSFLSNLFDGNQTQLINIVENSLMKRYLQKGELKGREMEIVFAIGGAARLLVPEQSNERIEMVVQLIQRVLQET